MAILSDTHLQGHARAADALYRCAAFALLGAALLGPALLASDFKTGAVQIRLGCALTCVEVTAVPEQTPARLEARAQDAFIRGVAARLDDVGITVSLSALRQAGEPARASL